jgi:hypothetical protein
MNNKAQIPEELLVGRIERDIGVVEAANSSVRQSSFLLCSTSLSYRRNLHLHNRTGITPDKTILARQISHLARRGLGAVAGGDLRAQVRVKMRPGAGAVAV